MSWLGALNFLVLQWLGIRLARITWFAEPFDNIEAAQRALRGGIGSDRRVVTRYAVLRWIWPLTGWWNEYRWITQRPFTVHGEELSIHDDRS